MLLLAFASCNKKQPPTGVITPNHIDTKLTVCSIDTVRSFLGTANDYYTRYELKDESGVTIVVLKVPEGVSGYSLGTKFTFTNYTNIVPTKDSI